MNRANDDGLKEEMNITTFGIPDEGALIQAKNCAVEAEKIILMADNHRGYGMPVGGVAVYRNKISPAAVGFDISCGNKAVKLNLDYDFIKDRVSELANQIWENLSFGIGRRNDTPVSHDLFNDKSWQEVDFLRERPELKLKAEQQLGTIGSGNHYVDVFKDENNQVWVGVHFGSRGFGHTIASHFIQLAGDNPNIMDETPHTLSLETKEGQDYFKAMELAGKYAYAGRDWVCQTVADILGGKIIDEVHNHHNYAWKETHYGTEFVVVRKGATPAFPGQKGFVGSTMGGTSVIIEGVDSEKSKQAFYSAMHGAGRVMSRTQAAGAWKKSVETRTNPDGTEYQFKRLVKTQGLVNWDKVKSELIEKEIILKGGGADEAPEAYKNLDEVLELHKETISILHRLTPLIVCMATSDEFDPYKD